MSPDPKAIGLRYGEKFGGSGFYNWQFKTKMCLLQQGVWDCVQEKVEDGKVSGSSVERKINL